MKSFFSFDKGVLAKRCDYDRRELVKTIDSCFPIFEQASDKNENILKFAPD